MLTSTVGLGAICGGAWLLLRPGIEGLTSVVLSNTLMISLAILAFTATDRFYVALPCVFIAGCAMTITGIGAQTLIQAAVEVGMRGRIMAHNGGFGELPRLEEQLGAYASLVQGDTDSERYFALITQQADAHGGDVGAGITAAASWIAANLPLSSLNTIVATPDELWALRYPGQHALHVIERPAGPGQDPAGRPGLHVRSATSSIHVPALHSAPSVVVASERLDGETGWRMLAPGELLHVRPDLTVESAIAVPEPPARLVPLGRDNPNIDT